MSNNFMKEAIELVSLMMDDNKGGPFGAVIVKDGEIIAKGVNEVVAENDPTAHAEIVAIRRACQKLNTFHLLDCEIYTTCEPCPMCLGAIYWARIGRIYFGANRVDAAKIGFDDEFIYKEFNQQHSLRNIPMVECEKQAAVALFEKWNQKAIKIHY